MINTLNIQKSTVLYYHMIPDLKFDTHFQQIKIAVIIAIILGLATSIFFISIDTESFSAIYIVPGSIIHNPDDNTVLYEYGVKSSETEPMDYTLDTYMDSILIKTKKFSLNTGEILAEGDKIILPPETQYPSKISLKLTTITATEEVHFWIKKEGAP
jgi:hypothetical protein